MSVYRTPDSRFEQLPGYGFEPHYLDQDGLRMHYLDEGEGDPVLPVIVHGDAAFAGQGVVMETLALAQARGYYTCGQLHVSINNHFRFTTADPPASPSTPY